MDVKKGKANLFIQAQQASSPETKVTQAKKAALPQLAPIVAVNTKAPAAGVATTVKAEHQMSARAQQAHLRNQLDSIKIRDVALPYATTSVQNQLAPLENKIKTLMHEIDQLELENAQIQDEVKQSQEVQSAVESNLEKEADAREEQRRAIEGLLR